MNRTRWVIIISVASIIAVDSYLAATCGSACTISVTITKWGMERPIIPFAFGFLMGHFWAQDKL